jgi:hypothetical protein
MQQTPVDLWHAAVDARDVAPFAPVVAESAEFLSPVVHTPQIGKATVLKYLQAALAVLNNESFRYIEELAGPRSAMLEFELELNGVYVNGVDLIRWNAEGQVTQFKVMIRPLKGLNTVLPLMAEQLSRSF